MIHFKLALFKYFYASVSVFLSGQDLSHEETTDNPKEKRGKEKGVRRRDNNSRDCLVVMCGKMLLPS